MNLYGVSVILLYNLHSVHQAILRPWSAPTMRYVDTSVKKDLFFDRYVFLTLAIPNFMGDNRKYYNIATGVLISNDMVLTAYNPFRNLTKSAEIISKIYVCFMTVRQVDSSYTSYDYNCATVACGRQVIPLKEETLSDDYWHGPDKKHSPLHDLMVLKLDDVLDIWTPEKDYTYEERHSAQHILMKTSQTAGPLLTKIATADDIMTMPIKFASLGFKSIPSVRNNGILEAVEYHDSDNVTVDCQDWLPVDWGYFICLWNDPDFSGFVAGAMLFSNKTLYGVGSFTLWRGKDSILVFTDVRPYNELIRNTCSKADFE